MFRSQYQNYVPISVLSTVDRTLYKAVVFEFDRLYSFQSVPYRIPKICQIRTVSTDLGFSHRNTLVAKMTIEELYFITGNKNKLAEVQSIIGSVIPLKNQSLDLVEIQGSIEEISKDKCRRAGEKVV